MASISMSRTAVHPPQFQSLFSHSRCKCPRIAVSWTMTMDSEFSSPMSNRKKKEASVQLSIPTPLVSRVETSRFCDLRFDRLQPSDHELDQHKRLEFGQFVAREAMLEEEYWTAAWLRTESQWENRSNQRYADDYKNAFADKEYDTIKKRLKNSESYSCIITVKKEEENVKRAIIKSVVGTLDLSVRYLRIGETFPGERPNVPIFCRFNRTPSSRYGYIANVCVTKSARRQGIASNMVNFAIESAKSKGVERIYVHVDRNNEPAQILYQNLGFEMVEMANSLLLNDETYLLRLQT